jgi:tetratricopeptide (TPR) repeat protein
MPSLLTTALALHQAGQLGAAAPLYQQVIEREPENADALHLYGVLRHQQGDHAAAAELIGQAIALRPSTSAFHANLAEAYRALGQLDRALGSCRTALDLAPNDAEAHNNLGLVLRGLNRHDEAVEEFRLAMKLRPGFALAHRNLGSSLRGLGRLDEALTHFRHAVELAPDDARARDKLGQALLDLGNAADALPHCREAVRLRPSLAAPRLQLGNALLALGRSDEAKVAYFEAIRLDRQLSRSYAGLGLAWQQEGKLGDALAWMKRAVEVEPEDAVSWQCLAELHQEREDPAEAIACWGRALALNPNRAATHCDLARLQHEEGLWDDAEEHYQAALRLDPGMAQAHMGLAGLREEQGDLVEAERAIREALRVQPSFTSAHARLATLLRGRLPTADCAALQERLTDPQLSVRCRVELLFGLAHVLDAHGDYPGAAACVHQANGLTLEHLTGRKPRYDPSEHKTTVSRLLQEFGPAFFARTAGMGLPTRRPIFIFGLPRSGTTLIEQVLASHSQVHGAGEVRLAKQTFDAIPIVLRRTDLPLDGVAGLDAGAIQRLAQQYETRLTALAGSTAERIVDKMPDKYQLLGFLAALFPQAAFIHCRRDLRDVAVSCWMTDFRGIRWANDMEHIATRFQQYRRLMEHWRQVLPVPILEVDYEETVADLETVARRLIEWCGLAWEPACLRFHETQRPIRTASVVQVRQPIYQQSVGRWKHYERELAELFARLPVE